MVDRFDNQPLDFTIVKTARRNRTERPILPDHVQQTISKDLKDHLKQQKQKTTKTSPQEEMEPMTKTEKIKDMLNKQSLIIGAAPITREHLEAVEAKMISRGVLKESQPKDERH